MKASSEVNLCGFACKVCIVYKDYFSDISGFFDHTFLRFYARSQTFCTVTSHQFNIKSVYG